MSYGDMEPQREEHLGLFPGVGLLYAVLSAACFSVGALLVAFVREVHALEVTFARMTIQLIMITPAVWYSKEPFFGDPDDRLMLWLRAMLGTWSMCFMYYAIHHMPLGDASVLHFSSPVFVGLLAFLLVKEPCGIFESATTIVTFIGIVFIAQPPSLFGGKSSQDSVETKIWERTIASCCALLASICGAGVHVTLRRLKHVHCSTVIFTYSLWGVIQSAVVSYIGNVWSLPDGAKGWGCIIGVGLFAVAAQVCFTLALKTENAGAVSVLRSTEIVFAFVWEVAFLKQYPNVYSVVGGLLVMGCAVAYGIRKGFKIRQVRAEVIESEDEGSPVLKTSPVMPKVTS
ncbi:solute carrier family 35 member G1-like [Lineus longissimus]|uniref:solute carrier family 35 member G1-like n=1 Tax=Lineus longissimus TaxID=88925 RepID=UPI00315DA942